jgi:CDP-diacylglycerol--serine O-phosphatidyltransferase
MKKTRALLFVLPNLFTVSSILCGLYAIFQATEGASPDRFYVAAVAILFGVVFDAADGRVARLTRTQSDFGMQLDSLADVVTFGVAPAVVVYKWALAPFGHLGMAAAAVFAVCGALRLARFNVLAMRHSGPSRHFVGMPIPLAAAILVSLIMVHHGQGGGTLEGQPGMIAVVLVLSGLMVSPVRYRSFKKLRANAFSFGLLLGLTALVLVAIWQQLFSLLLAAALIGFALFGMLEESVRQARRLGRRGRSRATPEPPDKPA